MSLIRNFFVYGTLRPGGVNHYMFEGAIESVEDDLPLLGYDMHSMGSYPALVPSTYAASTVRGTLITIQKSKLKNVLEAVDHLEGYDPTGNTTSLYERVAVPVYSKKTNISVPAWMYLAGKNMEAKLKIDHTRRIYHGDWNKHYVPAK